MLSLHDQELHQMITRALGLVETLDVTDVNASRFVLASLDEQLSSIRHHIEVVDTLVLPVLEHTTPGSTVDQRETHGIVTRGLTRVQERAAELEIALEERRAYSDELAVDLYLSIATLALRTAQLDRTWADLSAAA